MLSVGDSLDRGGMEARYPDGTSSTGREQNVIMSLLN